MSQKIDLEALERLCPEMAEYDKDDIETYLDVDPFVRMLCACIVRLGEENESNVKLMERCRDAIGCFIHDEDANVLPETTLSSSEILELDEMFERLDEVIEGDCLNRKERG